MVYHTAMPSAVMPHIHTTSHRIRFFPASAPSSAAILPSRNHTLLYFSRKLVSLSPCSFSGHRVLSAL